jgi:AcrR family transcriptional regulator
VNKGEETRKTILRQAASLASEVGLDGLTIGRLADELQLSKSGLFAHFRSKDALQVQTLEFAAATFVDEVVRPALKAPRGEPRVRALFERWLSWAKDGPFPGGCLFVAASVEMDDQEGPARDELVRQQRDLLELIANVVRSGVREGQFHPDLDADQFAYEMHGVMLAFHHASRLLRDPHTEARARRALDRLLAEARVPALAAP